MCRYPSSPTAAEATPGKPSPASVEATAASAADNAAYLACDLSRAKRLLRNGNGTYHA